MGLDLMMYSRAAYDKYKVSDSYMDLEPELMYGRKTWSLYYFFKERATAVLEDEIFEIPRSAFEDFANALAPDKDFIMSTLDMDDEDIEDNYKVMEYVYDKFTDIGPQLGEDWDIRAFARWLAALPDIYKIYDEGGGIVMVASY